MTTYLFRSAAVWTVLGLASGLYYREFTKANEFTGVTQLSVAHTHLLALGTIMVLVMLALQASFDLGADKRMRWAAHLWNAGLFLTSGMLTVKGTLQVLGSSGADSKALAGIAGLGHMTLTAAFVIFFLVLGARIKAHRTVTSDH